MKYGEETLQIWTAPLSDSENERIDNTIRMIKSAIATSEDLKNYSIDTFAQGSYANNTNVRNNSDIDICVMCRSTFFDAYPVGMTREQYGFSAGSIAFSDFKALVLEALEKKFGEQNVHVGNKSLKIASNTYHIKADVIPAFQYRNYQAINSRKPKVFLEGIKFIARDGSSVINYPKEHLSNGRHKNIATNYDYKRLVRIMKHIRNDMVDDGIINGDTISSFLVECLIWNLPDNVIMGSDSWTETLKNAIEILYTRIERGEYKNWTEVSRQLNLFSSARKWAAKDVSNFLMQMWGYLKIE